MAILVAAVAEGVRAVHMRTLAAAERVRALQMRGTVELELLPRMLHTCVQLFAVEARTEAAPVARLVDVEAVDRY